MVSKRLVLLLVVLCSVVAISSLRFSSSANFSRSALDPQTDPNTALSRGRSLLKQGHADQALGYLEAALNQFTQTNNARGIAAAQDALGDLYMIQGQDKVALDHYRKAYESFVVARGKDQTDQAAASNVASRAGATANAATQTAGSLADNGFNANLMLAKIGDANYRLGHLSEAGSAYLMMNVKKPESAAAKTTRRFGGLGGIAGIMSTGRVSVEAPTSAAVGLLEAKKELDEYRIAIVYMTYELGLGRLAFANNDQKGSKDLPPSSSTGRSCWPRPMPPAWPSGGSRPRPPGEQRRGIVPAPDPGQGEQTPLGNPRRQRRSSRGG